MMYGNEDLEKIVGKTMKSVVQKGRESIQFETVDGEMYSMYYEPDCCASCSIEDVVGDLQDLVGSPIAMAEVVTNNEDPPAAQEGFQYTPDSYTWTFYKLATAKGYVTIRWYGESNGYYSETASFRKVA